MTKTLKDKQTLYVHVFKTEEAKEVLADLRGSCFGTKTTFVKGDPEQTLINEGRRQAFMQIMNYIKVDYSEYYEYNTEDYDGS